MHLIRVGFTKEQEACYISHLDLQRVIQRALKKAEIPTWYTQGFNPHVYLTFALPLSLGQSSTCETFDYKTEAEFDSETVYYKLNEALPRGIRVYDVHPAVMDPNVITYARYLVRFTGDSAEITQNLEAFRALSEAIVYKKTKKGTQKPVDLMEHLVKWSAEPTEEGVLLDLTLPAGNQFSLNPDFIIAYLAENYGIDPFEVSICRTAVYNAEFENFV